MESVSAFGFDSRKHSISVLMSEARRIGMTVGKRSSPRRKNRIWVSHIKWRGGVLELGKVRQPFATFREALRSFDHTLSSIVEKALQNKDLEYQLDMLRDLLRSPLDKKAKLRRGEELLLDMFSELIGARTANLHEVRELVGEGEDLVQKGVLELLEDGNFGAACCTIVQRLLPLLQGETKRVLEQIPRVSRRKKVLGLIWEHDLWYARRCEQRLFVLAAEGEKLAKGLIPFQEFLGAASQCLQELFPKPYSWRLEQAFLAVESVKSRVEKRQILDRRTLGLLRRALTYARQELEWLELRDRDDLPGNRQRDLPLLRGVA